MTALLAHLSARGFEPHRYNGVFLADDSVTLALWNLSGRMVGYQTYRPDAPKTGLDDPRAHRYFTFVSRPAGSKDAELAVWGLEIRSGRTTTLPCGGGL